MIVSYFIACGKRVKQVFAKHKRGGRQRGHPLAMACFFCYAGVTEGAIEPSVRRTAFGRPMFRMCRREPGAFPFICLPQGGRAPFKRLIPYGLDTTELGRNRRLFRSRGASPMHRHWLQEVPVPPVLLCFMEEVPLAFTPCCSMPPGGGRRLSFPEIAISVP